MKDLLQDIRFTWRNALKRPATSLLIIITLALGIGANTAMFSMVWHVLMAPLPYADGERLVSLTQVETASGLTGSPWHVATFSDMREQNTAFDGLIAYVQLEYTLLGHGEPHFATTGIVNHDYFDVLGIKPLHGRAFAPADDTRGGNPVMLLGHDFWAERFGSDPAVIGTILQMNNRVYTVIGVLPPLPPYPRGNDIWIPAATDMVMSDDRMLSARRDSSQGIIWSVFGKLQNGVTLDTAQRDVATVAERLRATYPDAYTEDYTIAVAYLRDELEGTAAMPFILLLGLAILVLLIACANVANLNLAGMSIRNKELAIREAVGASPARLRRQLLTENFLTAMAGGLIALALAFPVLGLLSTFASGYTALAGGIRMNGPILGFSLVVAMLACALSSLATIFSTRDINRALKEGGDKVTTSTTGTRRRQTLLVLQLALSFVMLTTSALIVTSLYRLNTEDPGYDPEQVLVVNTQLGQDYPTPYDALAFIAELNGTMTAIPGISAAAVAGAPLLQNQLYGLLTVAIEGRNASDAATRTTTAWTTVTEDYFNVMNIPVQKGRAFAITDDDEAPPVIIINETFERRHFPAGDALGQRLSTMGSNDWRTIIGVVGDIRAIALDQPPGEAVYTSIRQAPTSLLNLYLKTSIPPSSLIDPVAAAFHAIDPRLAIENILPLEAIKTDTLAPRRMITVLITTFGVVALLVTLAGVIGVVSCNVTQRMRETSVHIAVGATPAHIMARFISQGMTMFVFGLLVGLLLMLAMAALIKPFLYGTSATELAAYTTSALILFVTVLVALLLPARKAAAMNPMQALHAD